MKTLQLPIRSVSIVAPGSFLDCDISQLFRWPLQVIFRCDLLPWAGLMGMHMLLERQISIGRGLAIGALAAAGSLAVTVLVDSAFWGRWLWPEGEVLWFNTAENR